MVRWIRGGRIRDIELDGIKRERYRPLSSLFPLRFVLICLADEKKNTAGGGGGERHANLFCASCRSFLARFSSLQSHGFVIGLMTDAVD